MVSRLAFGCEPLGGTDWGPVDLPAAEAAVRHALECGITLFDVADVYGLGQAEERLSAALGPYRHQVTIITKGGINWTHQPGQQRARTFCDSSPRHLRAAVEASLRRLRLECLPLYLVHWPDPQTPLAETFGTLQQLQQEGKLRYFGVSNFSLELLQASYPAYALAAVECQYNLLDTTAEQHILPFCQQQPGVLAYGPLAQGLLTGKYDNTTRFGPDDRRHRLPHFQPDQLPRTLALLERLREVAAAYGTTPTQVALRWVLDRPEMSCAIAGARSPAQVAQNSTAMGWHLSPFERAYLAGANNQHETQEVTVCTH